MFNPIFVKVLECAQNYLMMVVNGTKYIVNFSLVEPLTTVSNIPFHAPPLCTRLKTSDFYMIIVM